MPATLPPIGHSFAKERILTPAESAKWAVSDDTMREIEALEAHTRSCAWLAAQRDPFLLA